MAEAQSDKNPSLAEDYLLEKEKQDVATKPVEVKEDESAVTAPSVEVATDEVVDTPAAAAAVEESKENNPASAAEESTEESSASTEDSTTETAPPAAEESSETTEEENSGDQEASEETPEIKLETAPADFRFPTTNQTRHCFTRYIEYHRCVAAKGEGAPECEKFAKYYRSLCPSDWIEKWNEQRENGTFPGPL